MPDRKFEDIIAKLPEYLRDVTDSELICLESRVQRRSLRSALPAARGVYVLYDGETPMYVGRSDRLADRLLEHGRSSSGPESATFAFNLAYAEWSSETDLIDINRRERQTFMSAPEFHGLFDEAKRRVRKMCVRVVAIMDPVDQAVFEICAHLRLRTPYNSFKNH